MRVCVVCVCGMCVRGVCVCACILRYNLLSLTVAGHHQEAGGRPKKREMDALRDNNSTMR